MPHIAVKVNMLTDTDVEPVNEYGPKWLCKCVTLVSTTQNSTTLLFTGSCMCKCVSIQNSTWNSVEFDTANHKVFLGVCARRCRRSWRCQRHGLRRHSDRRGGWRVESCRWLLHVRSLDAETRRVLRRISEPHGCNRQPISRRNYHRHLQTTNQRSVPRLILFLLFLVVVLVLLLLLRLLLLLLLFILFLFILLFYFSTPVVKIPGIKNKKVKNIVSWGGASPIRWGPKRYPNYYYYCYFFTLGRCSRGRKKLLLLLLLLFLVLFAIL